MAISIIVLALILGVFFTLDLFFNRKKAGSFVKTLIFLFTVSIPALYQGTFSDSVIDKEAFASLWISYFYPTFALSLVFTCLAIYQLTYKPLLQKYRNPDQLTVLTFLDFLYNGYHAFKEEIEKNNIEQDKQDKKEKKEHLKVILDMEGDLKSFFHQMCSTLNTDTKSDGYVTYFLFEFINVFFGKSNARFTFRKLDNSGTLMVSFLTTSQTIPSPIPLTKRNLIIQSKKEGKPLIYSKNKYHHHKTANDSHGNNKYDDYVSYCLLDTEDNKPYISLSLDVKGEMAKQRMHALVDSSIYQLICQVLTIKILQENEQV